MIRVGLGYDIHRLEPGRRLVLGGVEIPFPLGLAGHSDADVAVHALMDALLGAAGLPDIGTHFPPSDARFQGASSLLLLATVRDLVRAQGMSVVNADVVVVAESPKLAPHVEDMRERIASALGLSASAIGIKATTNEEVGPEGRGEAISAHAVALLQHMS
jgi:2-C-methyl-D-erythritol 2,4-cyclodiphosphate synthase